MDFSGLTFLLNVHHINNFPGLDQIVSMVSQFLSVAEHRKPFLFKGLLLGMLNLVFHCWNHGLKKKFSEELFPKKKYRSSFIKDLHLLNNQKQVKLQKLSLN